MSRTVYVTFEVYASTTVELRVGDEATREEIVAKAAKRSDYSLCHECSGHVEINDLGEATSIRDEDGEELFTEEES